MLLRFGCVHRCAVLPPQLVCWTTRISCERHTRSSREDSFELPSNGGPISCAMNGCAGLETSTTMMPAWLALGTPAIVSPSVRLPT
jgi:hypothetical protein